MTNQLTDSFDDLIDRLDEMGLKYRIYGGVMPKVKVAGLTFVYDYCWSLNGRDMSIDQCTAHINRNV